MKTIIIVLLTTLCISATANAQTYKFLTTIESVIPGMGRSRMVIDEGNNELTEIELKNFFSLVGIQFANIKDNNTLIAEKLSEQEKKGYKLVNVSTGVYGGKDSQGIFITRYLFRKD